MCCFSKPVRSVSNTKIFCRVGPKGYQVVVYSMRLDADQDLAMILPVPVIPNSADGVVKFLDFSGYGSFFEDIEKNFPEKHGGVGKAAPAGPFGGGDLEVKKVGSFDASFIPTVSDFSRLDERFSLDEKVWKKLPQFADYGFVVFKLRKGENQVHPMGFAFPTRDRSKIVFPTVHIHDGKVHENERFDHSLYCQFPDSDTALNWEESTFPAQYSVKCSKTQGTVQPKDHIFRTQIQAVMPNEDMVIGSAV